MPLVMLEGVKKGSPDNMPPSLMLLDWDKQVVIVQHVGYCTVDPVSAYELNTESLSDIQDTINNGKTLLPGTVIERTF